MLFNNWKTGHLNNTFDFTLALGTLRVTASRFISDPVYYLLFFKINFLFQNNLKLTVERSSRHSSVVNESD